MRMHTDTLTKADLEEIAIATLPKDVAVEIEEHGSRKRARVFEIRLFADNGKDRLGHTRRPANSGIYGSSGYRKAATWWEWGDYFAGIFRRDQVACIGPYDGVAEYLEETRKYDPDQRDTPVADRVSPWLEDVEPERSRK